MSDVYFFGCWGDTGHYMFTPEGRTDWEFLRTNPWGTKVDAGLCPMPDRQGNAALYHKDGWTALAFWDRTIDRRPNSNTCLLVKGTLTFEQMLAVGAEHFPERWKQIAFPIVLAEPSPSLLRGEMK